jgi:two-component sensor histidine kinase
VPGPPEDGLGPEGGLGLRLVRALVEEELGGQFTLTHPAGRGSIATATIPPVERAG